MSEGRARHNFRNRYLCRDGSVVDIQWSARWLPEYGIRISAGHELTALLTGCGDSAFVLDIVTLLRARFRPWPDPAKGTNTG